MDKNENIRESMSQRREIRAWLESGNSITAFEALHMYGCLRLASRIYELREEGMDITVKRIITPSGKCVAQYSLKK